MATDQHLVPGNDYVIRKAVAHDVPLILDSWLNSWRQSKYAGVIRNNDYYETQRSVIEDLIARGATLIVADAGRTLFGWACSELKDGLTVVHFVWVKDIYLRKGVEEALLDALPGTKPGFFTHYLHALGKNREWRWAPEMARRKTL